MEHRQDPHTIVTRALSRLEECFRARDVEAAVASFTPQGAVYGDDLAEQAHGHVELRPFLAEVFEEPWTLGWDVADMWVRRQGDVLWFVATADAVLRSGDGDGDEERRPFRVSGVLRAHGGSWRFELVNGAQPARADGLVTA